MMISVVVPVYGCADCLVPLHKRLQENLLQITDKFEIIFVDDCGPDNSWEIMTALAKNNSSVKSLRLSKNFGQHIAISAGIAESQGDWIVVMDCDLQDPPEKIIDLYQKAQQGFDIVLAKRKQKQHSFFRKTFSKFYFKCMDLLSKHKFNDEFGSFSIISRKVAQAFCQFKDKERHYLFILYWLGFNNTYIEYEHAERYSGQSSYTLINLIKHALSGLLFQSTTLLRWIIYLGFYIAGIGILLAFYFIYRYFTHSSYPGWTSLAVLILVIGGLIMTSLGIVGLYIAGIFEQVKERPLYVIDKKILSNDKN